MGHAGSPACWIHPETLYEWCTWLAAKLLISLLSRCSGCSNLDKNRSHGHSKLLTLWRDQGVLVPLPGRGKRNMAYTKPGGAYVELSLLSDTEDNNEQKEEKSI